MKVLLIPSSYPPVLGGLQTVTHTLAQNLLAQGHQVQVVTNRYPRSLPRRERVDSVPVERMHFLWPNSSFLRQRRFDLFLASLVFGPLTLLGLYRLLRRFRPDVVNVHFPDAQLPFLLRLRPYFSFRLVVSLHGDDVLRWTKRGGRRTADRGDLPRFRSILRAAHAVTACSGWLLAQAIEVEPSVAAKGHVIHNGVELERFEDRTTYLHPRPYVFAFGRLTHDKGWDMLINALAQSAPFWENTDLILAGTGEDRESLDEQVRHLGLTERVHFWGLATPEEVVHLLNGCQLVVVPSRRETFGITALEGLAAGKPVLATRVGGLPEVLGEGPGVQLVEPTVPGLADGLATLLSRTAAQGEWDTENRQRAALFGWDHAMTGYLRVYAGAE